MSVFGGDSWAREAQYRKRRVDDLVVEALDGSTFKKLSNGKFACLLCPRHRILDSPLMLSMHCKGSCHRAAESRLKERELARQHEMNKRIALSMDCTGGTAKSRTCNQEFELGSKPLIEQSWKSASEIPTCRNSLQDFRNKNQGLESSTNHVITCETSGHLSTNCSVPDMEVSMVRHQHLGYRERVERELKFTAAGWKRDCHGKWYKDENVEFDSDEEDPNVCLG